MSHIQFNLLPDVKLKYINAQQTRTKISSIATLVTVASAALFVILLTGVYAVQKKQLADANTQISAATTQLQAVPNINKALTVQSQLASLATLHQNKTISSRLFGYLSQVTPVGASIGTLNVDFAKDQITISGTANSQATVNTFIDTLKFTQYKVGSASAVTAFTSPVESGFSINANNVSYSLTVQFDPKLFANNLLDSQGAPQTPKLVVPSQYTTRAVLQNPSSVFSSTGSGQ